MSYLYIKAIHIIFVASWFAGLFYLPRIFVNLTQVKLDSDQERNRLLLMARRLFRFCTIIAVPALVSGWILFAFYGIGQGSVWIHVKLLMVLCTICFHVSTWYWLRAFERGRVRKSHVWFRWYNEVPLFFFVIAIFMVVVKPF